MITSTNFKFQLIHPTDQALIEQVANWYLEEWKIPVNHTIQNLKTITADPGQFQVLMTLANKPIATGGIYNRVGLLDRLPRLTIYQKWLALVYTVPEERQKGYGALICNYIEELAKDNGLANIYLFTDTAESLYQRLGWNELERVEIGSRNIVIMEKSLNHNSSSN